MIHCIAPLIDKTIKYITVNAFVNLHDCKKIKTVYHTDMQSYFNKNTNLYL